MESMRDIEPIKPVAPYIGGKRNLSRLIVQRIEEIPHDAYAKGFVGMAGVFLRRRRAPRVEVINDLNRDVATFLRILQRHYVPFMEMMRFQLTTRAEFERLAATDPTTLTDLERSARFFYLQRTAFGGKVHGRNFGVSASNAARFDITRLEPMLEEVHARLAGVVIECLPAFDFIRRYDRPGMLFYLDPPYHGSAGDYGPGLFQQVDFGHLATLLATFKGRFLLSLNDLPEIRDTFARFTQEAVRTTYSIRGSHHAKQAAELLISGP
jgi:DNA adenine methylase